MLNQHGNEMRHYFFATSKTVGGGTLPHCPCTHRHRTMKAAKRCAKNRGNTHVREVYDRVGIADHAIQEQTGATIIEEEK